MENLKELTDEEIMSYLTTLTRYNWYGQMSENITVYTEELKRRNSKCKVDWNKLGF